MTKRTNMLMQQLAALLLTLFSLMPVMAHVVWIEPSDYIPKTGEEVALTLYVGEEFTGETILNIPEWFIRFSRFHEGLEEPVRGELGDDPAGRITIGKPGSYLVLYENKPVSVELEAAKFHDYLEHNGLEAIIEQRKALGESMEAAGEYYSRCARTVVSTTGNLIESGSFETGCTLDLLLTKAESANTDFRLLFKGQPLADALVIGISKNNPEKPLNGRTDQDGVVRFPGVGDGTWLFSAVHMIRETRDKAKWRSYWASMTFRLK